jgi:glutaredoxin
MQAQVLGLSVDSTDCLRAWAESLGGIAYPLLSDFYPHGQVGQMYGVLRPEGYSERAIFVIDKKGIIRYVDVHDINEQPDNEVLFKVLEELEPRVGDPSQRAATQVKAEEQVSAAKQLTGTTPVADVVLYCTPWCPDCRRARAYFKEHGISYVEVDISRDRAAAQQVRTWANGNETTPSFKVRDTIIVEFDKVKLDKALGIA